MKVRGRAGTGSVLLSSPDAGLSDDVHLHLATMCISISQPWVAKVKWRWGGMRALSCVPET